jgi:hypothetical protein
MISSTSPSDRNAPTNSVPASGHSTAHHPRPQRDQISTEHAEFLQAALQRHPEIRPEVVERGRALLSDPNYPPRDVLQQISGLILNSPDLTEDAS